MALTNKDPHNAREMAAVLLLGARIARREARGKSTKRLENRVDRIREKAEERENGK
ncbi:hypothetical protein [Streptomyces sp. NBC_00996]|uniref:hypothetical protein n=1 Tax=Streptomyces sp. NBC_00996 TaxID=2903710 RepID=UPI00386312D5|nr:hypothetical protein OG390_15485 [Streptomyces sp. NBC_00996]